jgi:hypothetical protein
MSTDPRTEALLKKGAYKFQYVAKEPFTNIDLPASEINPARLNRKIDILTVNQYGCAMLDGAVFPAIVLLRQDRAKHIVATGMHRIKAALDIKKDWFDAYIVTETDQFRCDALIRLLNSIEGRGDTVRDQLRHVVSLHEIYPKHSLAELATMFNLTKGTVLNSWNEHQGIQRASRLGFDFEGSQRQPQNTIVALNTIGSDLVYVKAAEFVVHFDVPGSEVTEIVKELKEVRHQGEGAEIKIVQKHHDIAEERYHRAKLRTGKTKSTECVKFIGKCKALSRLVRRGIEHLHLSALGISNYPDALVSLEDAMDNLAKVKAEIERIQRLSASAPGGSGGSGGSGVPIAAAPRS